MKAILSADRKWGIGYQNKLLISIPSDMKYFREMTTGKVVVMGRKTLESFPDGRPLKERTNVVLTHEKNYQVHGAIIVHNENELINELKKYPQEDIYVVGGGAVYELMLPYCDIVYVTRIDMEYQADTFFPDLDQDPQWELTQISEPEISAGVSYRFTTYQRKM